MAITETEMATLRALFIECAGSLLNSEREQISESLQGVDESLHNIEERLTTIEKRLDGSDELDRIKNRLLRIEGQVNSLRRRKDAR